MEGNLTDAVDPNRRFGGMARLYGPEAIQRLAAAHCCVIGIGGVGSWAVEALARSGIGRLTLIDLDHVAESNINRQIHALEGTLGMAKVEAMAARIRAINPGCDVLTVDDFVTPENAEELLPVCDGIIDAIDQVKAKAALIDLCRRRRQFLVTTGGAGGRVIPGKVTVADLSLTVQDALAASLRARLRKEYGFPKPGAAFGVPCVFSDEPIRRPVAEACESPGDQSPQGLSCAGYGSSVAVTATFGFTAASILIDRIAGEKS